MGKNKQQKKCKKLQCHEYICSKEAPKCMQTISEEWYENIDLPIAIFNWYSMPDFI